MKFSHPKEKLLMLVPWGRGLKGGKDSPCPQVHTHL